VIPFPLDSTDTHASPRIAIREDLLSTPLDPLSRVRLVGTRCSACGEVTLGASASCANCCGTAVEAIALSPRGTLWTYTVIRNRPPGDYRGPEPFTPYGVGLVELSDGIRVLSPLGGDVDGFSIGEEMVFEAYCLYRNAEGAEVIAFRFLPVEAGSSR
jgi:hypothetical protein